MAESETPVTGSGGRSLSSAVGEIIQAIVLAVILAFLIRSFLFQPFFIPSGSMEPTLTVHDRIIVNKIIYRFREPERGDIIVFKYPVDPSRDFVKRLIGKPGDKVEIRNSKVYVNGAEMTEKYLPAGMEYSDYNFSQVPQNHYLVLGDNRENSEDSRYWGTLPRENIIGRAEMIYWPIDRFRFLHNAGMPEDRFIHRGNGGNPAYGYSMVSGPYGQSPDTFTEISEISGCGH